jgi:hypothetical protein
MVRHGQVLTGGIREWLESILLEAFEKLHKRVEYGRVCLSQIIGTESSLVPLFPGNNFDIDGVLMTDLMFAY